jgi:hypothetical protein
MKRIRKYIYLIICSSILFAGCEDFLDINKDPKAANSEQVQVEYFLNNSITGAQMDPHVAERAFVLYWKIAARQWRGNGSLATGGYSDDWSGDYYNYLSGWLKSANAAIAVADEKIENNITFPYTSNLKQIARIWRVYLMSEFTDNFGPMPIDGFQGINPDFVDVKAAYYFMLDELRDAVNNLDVTVENPAELQQYDKAYGFDYLKWKKYGNSMRLRLAMRLSEVDEVKARSEFEDAVSDDIILLWDETFKVAERPGWDPLSGVMTRTWNSMPLSATLNNLFIGLGGIPSADQLPESFHDSIKPAGYMGIRYENHWGTYTNDPYAGFWLDGLPHSIDPRAYKSFIIPGWFDNPNFCFYGNATTTTRNLIDVNGVNVPVNAALTWNAACLGNWGPKASKNQLIAYDGATPRLGQQFRNNDNERIFFAPWETYFLIAEADVRGWTTPIDGKTAYESGIESSFNYWGVGEFTSNYILSEDYNRIGTSVRWDHTAEPPESVAMEYINGYTLEEGTFDMVYPTNNLHGTNKNDHLTKIITQKFIAQQPWLPLEAWSDHRRLGLPFFENPSVELPLPNLPDLTQETCFQGSVNFFPQRLKYPSGLQNSNPAGYTQALEHLGGEDAILTPLWWAKKQP